MSTYSPRQEFIRFHERNQRFAILVAHRRCGKTVSVVNDIVEKALYNPRPSPRYAYIAPFLKQAKDIAWQYLKVAAAPYGGKANESGLYVELEMLPNRPRITIYGADNPDSFRGLYLDGAALDEFGNMRASIFQEILLPALIDRRGWAVFMGTPNGPNHFRDMWYDRQTDADWFTEFLPVSKTKRIPLEELTMMRKLMDPEQYAQEMECSFEASVRGAIYARQMEQMQSEDRIGEFPLTRELPVDVFCDLGFSDATTIGFWQCRPDAVVIDKAIGDNMKPISHYIQLIKDYFTTNRVKRGHIWLPHDAQARTLVTGKSIQDEFIKAGLKPHIVPKLSIQDGINAVRELFPHLHLNRKGCETLELALKSYHREYDEETKTYKDVPVHDWSSHWTDMVRYGAVIVKRKGVAAPQPLAKGGVRPVHYGFALNDIWDCCPNQPSTRL